jgi:uncharacterized repeat protein (TIGR03806 family)
MLVRSLGRVLLAFHLAASGLAGPAGASGLDARPANPTCRAPSRAPDPGAGVALAVALGGAVLASPTAASQSPVDPAIWYVAERAGRLRRVDAATGASTVALDLSSRITQVGEGGLVGLALHPAFAENGHAFVYYTPPAAPLRSVLSRFTSTDGGLTFALASERVLLDLPQEEAAHLGGAVHFGADGMLYVSLGDNFDTRTPQDLAALRGKVLRLDVDGGAPYAIPADNPFVGVPGARGEVWALGFRNPYRWSFDMGTGALWLADVGDESWEEVDLVVRGGNYGWPLREGAACRVPGACNAPDLLPPAFQYSHDFGCAVIGGFVYRGASLPGLAGHYVYGDLCSRRIWSAAPTGDGYALQELAASPETFYGFAQARDGEILVLGQTRARRLVPAAGAEPPTDAMPALLSRSGCVDPGDPRRPSTGMIPYDLVQPFWSDQAAKERWLALPDGARIAVDAEGDFALPPGAVAMKSFRLGGRLIETRFLVRHGDGSWGGYTYEWNESETEAALLAGPKQRVVGDATWTYPSQAQCFQCHTTAAGVALGLESAQLNRDLFYPHTARTANQLATLSAIGMFETPMPEPIGARPRLERTSLDQQARAWLHSNCAGCHRPGGPTPSSIDLRATTPFAEMGICNVAPALGDLGIAGGRLLLPGDPARSLLSVRTRRVGAGQMPPLARARVDARGAGTLDLWITSITSCSLGPDSDFDGIGDAVDKCPATPDPAQLDGDGDGIGDACETPCRNGVDDDGDGFVDYPRDPGCRDPLGGSEQPACDDGLDDDGDGQIDGLDIGCAGRSGSTEQPACADGVDNDADGRVDWDGAGTSAPDPECRGLPTTASERGTCGLGAELPLVLGALAAARRRRRLAAVDRIREAPGGVARDAPRSRGAGSRPARQNWQS